VRSAKLAMLTGECPVDTKYEVNGNVDKRAQSENQAVSQEGRCYCRLEQG